MQLQQLGVGVQVQEVAGELQLQLGGARNGPCT
jgi:hypothetical protein